MSPTHLDKRFPSTKIYAIHITFVIFYVNIFFFSLSAINKENPPLSFKSSLNNLNTNKPLLVWMLDHVILTSEVLYYFTDNPE